MVLENPWRLRRWLSWEAALPPVPQLSPLTGQPGWMERNDITIYQLGWRLGGKGRSGRNRHYGQRTEEITDHALVGIYHNTKKLLKSLYKELNRSEGSPMRTFKEAFKLMSFFGFED